MKKSSTNTASRVFYVALAILLQVLWIIFTVMVLGNRYVFVSRLIKLFSVLAVLWLVNNDTNPSYKLVWVILILAVPIAGAVIYFIFGKSRISGKLEQRLEQQDKEGRRYLKEEPEVRRQLARQSEAAACESCYIASRSGYPVYSNTQTKYYRMGQEMYVDLLAELEKAEHFIFMEYFIIEDGKMWQSILDILERKVKLGLDVRLIYDDWGCASKMPETFQMQLRIRGIRCEVFNPLIPIAAVVLNNRDHRKITVVDGWTAFTGGVNLADEYINEIERFGVWKDTGVMLKGEAVWNFTVMFLEMWDVLSGDRTKYEEYRPHRWHEEPFAGSGFVQPYCDTPLDHETVGENVYLNIINRAKKYVYIFTPYLIIDNEMKTALCLAAKSGIDVRIVTPGIPDKKLVFLLTQSYYAPLLKCGVRIYEYTPGFIHAKSFVCDDQIAVVGSINLDYRSLYLHFECGVWMYDSEAVLPLREDAINVFAESHEITREDCENSSLPKRISQSLLRLVAPLM